MTSSPTELAAELPMQPGIRFNCPTKERLQYTKQLGVGSVIVHPYKLPYLPDDELPLSTEEEWTYEQLVHLRTKIEDAGLRLAAIENLPMSFYDHVMLGGDKQEEQLELVERIVRNLGHADIPVLGYHWMPEGVWRTSLERPGRGGAEATAFDFEQVRDGPLSRGRNYSEDEFWDNYEYFLERVLPVAEEAGVQLCLHPDDPPVKSLLGIPRLFRNFENFKRAMDAVPSDNHGLEFCLGTWSEMDIEADLQEVIRYFGERGDITYVHFRDVAGTVPNFEEVFIDEGNYDEYDILRTLYEVGFDGVLIPDHVPRLVNESKWRPQGRGYTLGYIKGMLNAIKAEST